MTANSKQGLRELIERPSDEEARRLSAALQAAGTTPPPSARPLAAADIVLAEPVLREDETADEMIATVRRWRSPHHKFEFRSDAREAGAP